MKNLLSILAIIFVSTCYSQNDEFWFPKEMPINPLDYNLRSAGVRQIEIYQFRYYKQIKSTKEDSNLMMDFVINYDSLNRLSSIKYNFQRHVAPVLLTDNKTLSITANTDSIFLHTYRDEKDSIVFNSWISEYTYENNQLKNIEIKRPLRNMEDGLFMMEIIDQSTRIETNVENNFLKQKRIFIDEKLVATINYEYTIIEAHHERHQLLTKIITTIESNQAVTEQIIKYSL